MAQRNVTITLPEDTLLLARHIAVERGLSLSKLVDELLVREAPRAKGWDRARKRALARIRQGVDLGVKGRPTWSRDELHDR